MLLLSLTLVQASVACMLTGLLLWGLLSQAARHWPALAAQRSVWLGAQLVLAAAFVLPLLPATQQLSVVPEVGVPAALAVLNPLDPLGPLGHLAPGLPMATDAPATAPPSGMAWLALASPAWSLLYLLGLVCTAWRWR